jgi:SdrD B-like protein/putative type II/III system pilus formation protein
VSVLAVALLAPMPLGQAASSVVLLVRSGVGFALLQDGGSPERKPRTASRRYATRVKLSVRDVREVTFDEAVVAFTVIDTKVAAAEARGERGVVVTGLNPGETILIISGRSSRSTYVIEVVRPPRAVRPDAAAVRRSEGAESFEGFYGLHFSPGFDGAPSLLNHTFEFNQKLSGSRTLRASGELFNFFGSGERGLALPAGAGFGVNRVRLGVDSPAGGFDLLDSELNISRLGFDNYTMRGPHLVSKADSRWRGLEIFAGAARPQSSFFNEGEGRLAGALVPVAQSSSWRVRAGAFYISPRRESDGREGGMVWQADARFAPDESTTAQAEAAYANGALSWRTRLDLSRGPFNFYGELFKLDRRSPFVGVGAQSSGREVQSFGLQWRPGPRFGAALGYNSTTNSPLSSLRRLELNSRTLTATTGYRPSRGSRLGFSFRQQELETPTNVELPFLLHFRTRTATFKYDQRIGGRWTNDFEARFIQSREGNTGERMTSGVSLREQLRYSLGRGSLSGFVNYRSNTPSLTGLILRNPALLPPAARTAFTADPARYLLANRDALPRLLSGVELSATRSTEVGLRLQAALSRLSLAGEVRYGAGEVQARDDRFLFTTFSADLKLDAANSVQVSGAHAVSFGGAENRTVTTISYVHRFGASSGGGFQLSKLLGLSRGQIRGRVFLDLNGNGQDDTGEPGVGGMRIELDGSHVLTTDSQGRFNFGSLEPGEHYVALVSERLGIELRASSDTRRQLFLAPRETLNVGFGVTNLGFAAGRIFNDLLLSGEMSAGDAPGVEGVRLVLRGAAGANGLRQALTQVVNANGAYEFGNLPPGDYLLEVDPVSIPADFYMPNQTAWPVRINPLQGTFLDLPLAAQRAVFGTVFFDRDGDGLFNPDNDEPIQGAIVTAGRAEARTDSRGAYILRNLPAGKLTIFTLTSDGRQSDTISLVLGPSPVFRRNLNLAIHGQ